MVKKIDFAEVQKARKNLDAIKQRCPGVRAINENNLQEVLEDRQMGDKRKLLYTIKEAAQLLGCHVETLRRAVRRNELHAARVGASMKISGYELERFFQARGGRMLFDDEHSNQVVG